MDDPTAETPENQDAGGRSFPWIPVLAVLLVVGLALGAVGAVVAFSAVSQARQEIAVQRMQAERSRAEAMDALARMEEEEKKAVALREFLEQSVSNANAAPGRDARTDVRAALDAAAARLEKGEITDPLAAADLHSRIGLTYESLGDLEKAEAHLRAAVDLRARVLGDASADVATDRENVDRVVKARGT